MAKLEKLFEYALVIILSLIVSAFIYGVIKGGKDFHEESIIIYENCKPTSLRTLDKSTWRTVYDCSVFDKKNEVGAGQRKAGV